MRLRERRPVAVRRHTGRTATRFVILLAGDAIAFLVYLAIAKTLDSGAMLGVLGGKLARALTANPAERRKGRVAAEQPGDKLLITEWL